MEIRIVFKKCCRSAGLAGIFASFRTRDHGSVPGANVFVGKVLWPQIRQTYADKANARSKMIHSFCSLI